jgi:hypothetical protein
LALWLWAHSHDRGPSTHKAKIRVCDVPFTARSRLSHVRPTKLQPSAEHAPPSFPIPSTFVGPPSCLWQFGVKTRSSPKLSGTPTSRGRPTAVPVLFRSRSRQIGEYQRSGAAVCASECELLKYHDVGSRTDSLPRETGLVRSVMHRDFGSPMVI